MEEKAYFGPKWRENGTFGDLFLHLKKGFVKHVVFSI